MHSTFIKIYFKLLNFYFMPTFQKIRFVLTTEQLLKVLARSGSINGLVLDLSVKENYITVIDVNGYRYQPKGKFTVLAGSGESAIPTPPGAHQEDEIDLTNLENKNLADFLDSRGMYQEARSFQ